MSRYRTLIRLFVLPVIALAALPTPAPAQVSMGQFTIRVEAVLEEPTTMGVRMVFPFNGTAVLTSPLIGGEGESNVDGFVTPVQPFELPLGRVPDKIDFQLVGGPLIEAVHVLCTGTVDSEGNGSGRCAISGEVDGDGAWGGHIDVQARSLTLTIYLHVVCPRCAPR